jgi:hypothetical protein
LQDEKRNLHVNNKGEGLLRKFQEICKRKDMDEIIAWGKSDNGCEMEKYIASMSGGERFISQKEY